MCEIGTDEPRHSEGVVANGGDGHFLGTRGVTPSYGRDMIMASEQRTPESSGASRGEAAEGARSEDIRQAIERAAEQVERSQRLRRKLSEPSGPLNLQTSSS